MDLEGPTDAVCPLCEDEIVEIKPNSSDKKAPYFTCRTHQTTVPGMYGGSRTDQLVTEYVELAQAREERELNEPDDEGDTQSLADILGGDDDE